MSRKIVWLGLIIVLSMSTLFGTLWSAGLVTPRSYATWAADEMPDIIVPDHHSSIQKAIDVAKEGATIFIRSGTYRENITIDKPLKLEGQSRENTIINCTGLAGSGRVVFINSSDVTVTNLCIQDPDYDPEWGIQIGEEWRPCIKNINIIRNKIKQCDSGIEIKNASDLCIAYNVFEENTPRSIGGYGFYSRIEVSNNTMTLKEKCKGSKGIEIAGSNNSYFFNNTIVNVDNGICTTEDNWSRYVNNTINSRVDGILIKKGKNNLIVNNTIEHTRLGISIEMGSSNNVSTNKIASNSKGTSIKISSGENNTIAGNIMKSALSGIDASSSNHNSIEDNLIYTCRQACKLTSSDFNNITDNIICSSDYGIRTDMYSNNNSIYHNDFHKNNVQAYEESPQEGINLWDNDPETPDDGKGNYWSDYNGTDGNGDGVGDIPYAIDEHTQDNYPLVVPRKPIPVFYTVFHERPPYEEEIRCDCCVSAGNMTISRFGFMLTRAFNRTAGSIVFNVTISSKNCHCKVDIPKQLLSGAFEVYVDDIAIPCMACNACVPNQNCYYIYFDSTCFEFSEGSTYSIRITAETAIPLTGDVTKDGIVDIFDVVAVSTALGDSS